MLNISTNQIFNYLEAFHFIRPLWLLCLIPLFIVLVQYIYKGRFGSYKKFFSDHMINALAQQSPFHLIKDPLFWSIVITILITFCISGPTFKRIDTPFNLDTSKTILVFYNGESMLENDVTPSRIERAKIKVSELIKLKPNHDFSIVTVTNKSYRLLPFTKDTAILESFIKSIEPSIMPTDGREFESLNNLLLKDFNLKEDGNNVLIIADEINNNAISNLGNSLNRNVINTITYAIGYGESYSSSSVSKLATSANGRFVSINLKSNRDIETISSLIRSYIPNNPDMDLPWSEAGYYFLYLLIIPIVLYFRRGIVLSSSLVFVLSLSYQTPTKAHFLLDPFFSKDQQGLIFMKLGKFEQAAIEFEDPYYKAINYYVVEDFKNAEVQFAKLDTDEALFARANAIAHMGYYLSAKEEYEKLLVFSEKYRDQCLKNIKIMEVKIEEIDKFSEAQVSDGHEELNPYKEKFKRSKGAERELVDTKTFNSENFNQDVWLNKTSAPLKNFLSQKLMVIDEND